MRKYLLFILVLLSTTIFAQKKNENYKMYIKQSTGAIKIDGVLDDKAWFQAAAVSDFMMCNPFDTLFAQLRTDVKMAYDDKYIYISAECFLKEPGAFVVESMKRDFGFGVNRRRRFLFENMTRGHPLVDPCASLRPLLALSLNSFSRI